MIGRSVTLTDVLQVAICIAIVSFTGAVKSSRGPSMGEHYHDDDEALPPPRALPDCTEQQHCAKMTPQDRHRRCACAAVTSTKVEWKLTDDDRRFLRSMKIAPTPVEGEVE